MMHLLPHTLRGRMRTVARYSGNCGCSIFSLCFFTGIAKKGAKVLNYPSMNVHLPKFLYIISDNLQDLKADYF